MRNTGEICTNHESKHLKMKNLLYISTVEEGPFQGVRAKIAMQCKAFEDNGFKVELINSGIRTSLGQIEKLIPFGYGVNYRIIKKKVRVMENNSIDYCYARYSPASRGLIDVFRTLKSMHKDIKIILEIPTYPYENELKSLKAVPFKIRERMYRGKLKEYVDLIVTPSHLDDNCIFGVPAYEITNGIDLSGIRTRTPVTKGENIVNILGIALITAKQGFDRVLHGMHEYYKTKKETEPDIYFYIIGDGEAKNSLVELTKDFHITERVVFTGPKERSELDYFYDLADVGIGTLGLYKSNELSKVNSLKTREYCAKGLPFVITDCDYVFADQNFEYCFIIENDDSPVDMRMILGFLNKQKTKHTEYEIAELMANFAEEHLSWRKILHSVIDRVDGCNKSHRFAENLDMKN